MTQDREEHIRQRAYEIWERDGRPEGRDREHWLNAETEVAGQPTRSPGDEARPGSPQTGENICPDCGGSGSRNGAGCETCGGSGRITAIVGDA